MTTTKTDRYAVMGNPISHSKSPQIHQQFAEQTKEELSYEKIKVETENFADDVASFQKNNGKGLNITVPLKEEAFKLATELTERARRDVHACPVPQPWTQWFGKALFWRCPPGADYLIAYFSNNKTSITPVC